MPKLEMVLEKLGRLEAKLDSLENYIKAVDDKVSKLQGKVESFETLKTETAKLVKELEEGMSFANAQRKSFKGEPNKMEKELSQLKDEKLYMGVNEWRENLCFFGIKETATRPPLIPIRTQKQC